MSEPIQLGQGAFLPNNTTERYCLASRPIPGSALPDECFRAPGHEGRHAFISAHGTVVAVWGEDVHAEKRAKGRKR